MDYVRLCVELSTLRDVIEKGLKEIDFLYLPSKASLFLRTYQDDWAATIAAFPLAKDEIACAIAAHSCDLHTASIFHFMRVAEYGLRALAAERKIKLSKPIEWANWQEIISKVEDSAKEIGKTKPAGAGKDDALGFYNLAVAHFYAFKDKYRNVVMHARATYGASDAISAMTQVREFMNVLSKKINAGTKGPIKWKFK
jgi:hypothetical protein